MEKVRELLVEQIGKTTIYAIVSNPRKKGIDKKLDAISKRGYYTQYKTADTQEEREKARLKYLDAVGMHEDFRF